jgi:hypothetical protein
VRNRTSFEVGPWSNSHVSLRRSDHGAFIQSCKNQECHGVFVVVVFAHVCAPLYLGLSLESRRVLSVAILRTLVAVTYVAGNLDSPRDDGNTNESCRRANQQPPHNIIGWSLLTFLHINRKRHRSGEWSTSIVVP